jgi:hypothetical protein
MSAPTESDEPSALNSTNLSDDITPDQSISNVGSNSHRPRTRKRTAWVWNHMPDLDPETLYYSKDDRIEWRCKYCPTIYLESGGTNAIQRHLRGEHNITDLSLREQKALRVQASIEQAFDRAKETSYKRRRITLEVDVAQFEVLFVRWIARRSIPLRMVECEEFRALIRLINDTSEEWLPQSHTTITEWVVRTFQSEKVRIKGSLQKSKSKIHITCDLWTSPNSLAILGLVAHFIAENGELRHPVLALKQLKEEHSGENLAQLVIEVVQDYEIPLKLGYFMMDNARNNDTLMVELSICGSNLYYIALNC